MVKCLNIGDNIGKPIYRSISNIYIYIYKTVSNNVLQARILTAYHLFHPEESVQIYGGMGGTVPGGRPSRCAGHWDAEGLVSSLHTLSAIRSGRTRRRTRL